jgi:hypothetical protein
MKLKNYKELFEKYEDTDYDDESYYNEDEYLFGRPNHSKKGTEEDEDEDDASIGDSDMDNLLYLLRTMFKNKGIKNVYIEHDDLDITISITMGYREKIESIISVFDTAKRLKRDILPQYDSEFEMWETKDGKPLLTFNFYYGEGLEDDEEAF